MPLSAAPTPVPPALPCRGCAGSSASFPPPRYRCPSLLRRPAPAPGQPAAARPHAGECGTPPVRVPVPVLPDARGARPHPSPCSRPSRDPPPPREDAGDGAGKTGENRPLRPIRRLPAVSERSRDGAGWKGSSATFFSSPLPCPGGGHEGPWEEEEECEGEEERLEAAKLS